jgi:hypothetical protein
VHRKKTDYCSYEFDFLLILWINFDTVSLQGFARYSTDDRWHVPHFEKMLYDQAQLAVAYSSAYVATKDPIYADVVRDILTYVDRDLSDEVNFGVVFRHEMCEMGRTCRIYGKMRNAYKILVEKPDGKRPFRRPRLYWKDNIKLYLKEIGYEGID